MPDQGSIGGRYLDAQRSFVALVRGLDPTELAAPVPACPGWIVRDVVSHVAGVTDDALNGRLEGVATPAWTAAQIERWRDAPLDEVLGRWEAQAPVFAGLLDSVDEVRPPIDCHTHEHDVRGAVGRPGNRCSSLVAFALETAGTALASDRAITIEVVDGPTIRSSGDGPSITLRGSTSFEVVRSMLGRRSRRQVLAYDWSDDPAPVLDAWFLFGPAEADLVE